MVAKAPTDSCVSTVITTSGQCASAGTTSVASRDAALVVELRHTVGAVPGAVLAADAGIRTVAHDARHGIFRVGIHRASLQAGGLETVVAAHREVMLGDGRKEPPLDVADAAPVDRSGVAVLLVAGHDTALAADARAHVEVK